jgi:hypothetical protein
MTSRHTGSTQISESLVTDRPEQEWENSTYPYLPADSRHTWAKFRQSEVRLTPWKWEGNQVIVGDERFAQTEIKNEKNIFSQALSYKQCSEMKGKWREYENVQWAEIGGMSTSHDCSDVITTSPLKVTSWNF